MTTITVLKTEAGIYKGFYCTGHAESRRFFFEKDMVCAAASVLIINTINSLESLSKDSIEVVTNEVTGFIKCDFSEKLSESGHLLMDSMILGLQGIESQYGKKYLLVNFEEV